MPEPRTWLAFDLGAESGRAFTGQLGSGILTIQEIHRFPNEPVDDSGSLHWDAPRLWLEMRKALSLAGKGLEGLGVDSWGVDYALLDERGELLKNPYHYRDARNPRAMAEVLALVPREIIYRETGIQFMPINTINQLFAAKCRTPEILTVAKQLLMIPDLFNYWLTGHAVCEYTNATTTQLVNPVTRSWSRELIEQLGFSQRLFGEIVEPGKVIGSLRQDVALDSGLSGTPVIAPASHDTGSAVASVMAREDTAFLSSGTWSLLGIELDVPVITDESLRLNFTNEGGVAGTTRLLKNVMGLWMLQGCRRSWATRGRQYDHASLLDEAIKEPAFSVLIDPDDASFLNPADMPEAIDAFCRKTEQPRPGSPGAYTRAILESLALKYRAVVEGIELLTGKRIMQIRVIGGGSKNRALNQFTADASGRRVLAGPSEAAVLGNLGVQMLATGAAGSLKEVRAIIDRSFPTEIYEPADSDAWRRQVERFEHYCEFTYA
jgi:rhamnulokinase